MEEGNKCVCGHFWADHYDGIYCLEESCACGPCEECGVQFVENPVNSGRCGDCSAFELVVEPLLKDALNA